MEIPPHPGLRLWYGICLYVCECICVCCVQRQKWNAKSWTYLLLAEFTGMTGTIECVLLKAVKEREKDSVSKWCIYVCICVFVCLCGHATALATLGSLYQQAHSRASVFSCNWQPCVYGSVYAMVCGWLWECVQLADVSSSQFSPPSPFCVLFTLPSSQLIQSSNASLAWLFQFQFTKAISSSQIYALSSFPITHCTTCSMPINISFSLSSSL